MELPSGVHRLKGIFSDYEETILRPLYRDPIHDFGFFGFEPNCLQFMECAEISLNATGTCEAM